ncbi:MAG: M36 family metallopeptidase, partial [Ferruginibacter sp.]
DPNIERSVNVPSGTPAVSAESAVQSALSDRGFRASQMAIAIKRKDDGRFAEFGNMGISQENITAQLTWVPNELANNTNELANDSKLANNNKSVYSLAWQVYIIPKTTSDYWMVRVNAVDNGILGVDNYTDYDNWGTPETNPNVTRYPEFLYGRSQSNTIEKNFFDFKHADDPSVVTTATYRVIPHPAEAPSFPGGTPALRTDPWLAAIANAQTLKWNTGAAATDYNYTRGNNVFAYQDRTNDNNGLPADAATSTTALPNLTFDFVPNFTVDPTQTTPVPNQQFNTTNLFYWNNIIHDVLYAYGFTEAGRNFQDDNLGRGGAGADWVRAEAQDGGGTNNANFSTPADGSLPRMQMYLWTGASPFLDGDADAGIIIHEYGHGVSNRSNAGGTGCLGNAEQGGEGWSDYLGLMLTQNWATATLSTGFSSPRGIGTYALNQPPTGNGIRPQRYTTNFAINNATYATLPGQAIPHGVGWVWCSALWEMTWEVINDVGTISPSIYNQTSTAGNVVALNLVMQGLRTQQCQPGFISARNAILNADTTLYGAIHACAIWRAFARRGMGFGASEGSTSSINDQVVSFALPPACLTAGPTVTINQAAAQPDPTSVSPINFTVVFSEAVIGFATGDVALGGTAGATTATVTGGPTTFNVAVTGMTVTGTVVATIPAGVCTNAALDPNNASTSTDNTVTFTITPPGVCTTFAGSVGPANNPTSLRAFRDGVLSTCAVPGPCTAGLAGALHYVQHSWTNPVNAVQCVSVSYTNPTTNFSFVTAHNGSVVLTNLCTNYLGDPGSSAAAGGTPIVWSFNAPPLATIIFHVGNVTAGQTADYRLEITAPICTTPANNPTVTINQAAAQPDPTSNSPINFTVVFNQVVTGFATGDVVLTGTAGATLGTVTGSGTTYNVAVTGMVASGTVIATVPAGVAVNAALDPNNASTSTDNTVTYNFILGCTSVNPIPSDTVCNGATHPAVNFTSPTPGTVFNWTNNNTTIGLGASGTGNIPAFTATNATTAPVVATVTVTPSLPVGPIVVTSTLDASDAVLPQRIFRDAVPGTCPGPKVFPGLFATTGTYYYETYTYTNQTAAPVCVTASLTSTTTNQAHMQAYLGSFNPANQALNFLSDCGSSTTGPAVNMAFNAPAGSTIVFVVVEPISGQVCPSYTLTVDGLSCTGTPRTFNITVFPTGQVNPVPNQVVCRGLPTAPVNFTSTVPNTIYSWTNNNTLIGLAAVGNGNIPSFIAQNPTGVAQVATITVTPAYGSGGVPVVQNFAYTGAVQTWVVPAGVTSVSVKAWGAQGNRNAGSILGGLGGYAQGNLAVTPGQTLYINVGGGGTSTINGGFNGGGASGANAGCALAQGGGGGGASDVRVAANTLAARAIVGAGGGGAGGNRTAGCGRGTGGGGGAGYYGGGGGAGWPGVPPGGPVPTGGTQSAGGAAGITTWTAGGPTNGLPGALGIGGAGGIEVASAQGTPTGPAEPGGIGGGLIGAPGNYNPANNWNGQSGAGGSSYIGGVTAGVITPGLQTGNGRVEFTYAAAGITCPGTPRTFTITVNPNQDLIIVADPGTTLCEGDPTLLTVYNVGASTPPGNLY